MTSREGRQGCAKLRPHAKRDDDDGSDGEKRTKIAWW